jgi:hypothetical protein
VLSLYKKELGFSPDLPPPHRSASIMLGQLQTAR